MLLTWTEAPRADRYIVTRQFYGTRVLPKDTTVYSWADKVSMFDLFGTYVHPEFVLVKAMRGTQVLRTYTGASTTRG